MKNRDKEGLNFPLNVFVDTQIFIKESFNFSENGRLAILKKQVKRGEINFITSEIISREAKKCIRENVEKKVTDINNNFNSRELAILKEGKYATRFSLFNAEDMVKEAFDEFESYLNEVRATYLDLDTIELKAVLDDYFNGVKPFGGKGKKAEFPDALNISMLRKYRQDGEPIYVISGDSDYEGVEGVTLYKEIDHLLNFINDDNLIFQQIRDYIESIENKISDRIQKDFFDSQHNIEVDGYEYDRKGIVGGHEYVDVEIKSINLIEILSLQVIDYSRENKEVTIVLQCRVDFMLHCVFFDEENSIWDSEEKEYLLKEYRVAEENHSKKVELIANLFYKDADDEKSYPEFDINSIKVDTMQKFTQQSLKIS